ncbi:hypothetical protein OQJ26_00025 [Legionella sp. PATHC038]|nr:hypothetical protein [Legionella sp. PATHC038]MCW8397179.1 hypothetical protein [Legionella sp. PATHC038]
MNKNLIESNTLGATQRNLRHPDGVGSEKKELKKYANLSVH